MLAMAIIIVSFDINVKITSLIFELYKFAAKVVILIIFTTNTMWAIES